jgi:hypothetical protein
MGVSPNDFCYRYCSIKAEVRQYFQTGKRVQKAIGIFPKKEQQNLEKR